MNLPAEDGNKKIWLLLLVAAVLLNIPCLFNDILEPDGALYASIAKQIALSNNWSHLYVNGEDWLDKPHFPFWAAAASFKIFGINAFAYKLPSFLCFLVGLYYTYKLTGLLFNKTTAFVATIFYAAALHTILANFDVRAEGYLTAFVSASTFYLLQTMQQKSWRNILPASFFCALAVMTKGIFILVIIFSGFVLYWLLNKQWKQFVNPAWYLVVFFTLMFILPELYCLWLQFDNHPEKIIFGQTNVSGIRFFFWDSQFGRFFNTGPIKGAGDVSFFLHTTTWAYLPWSPVLIASVVFLIVKRKAIASIPKEFSIITGSALFGFLLFSFSKFQLPHYVVTLFPYFSMMAAVYVTNIHSEKIWSRWNIVMMFLFVITVLLASAIALGSKIPSIAGTIILVTVATIVFIYFVKRKALQGFIIKGICIAATLSIFLNLLFYPKLLQYQSGMTAAKWLQQNNNTQPVVKYRCNSFAFDFYSNGFVTGTDKISGIFKNGNSAIIYTSAGELKDLNNNGVETKILFSTSEFHVSTLGIEFMNDKTRQSALGEYVIAECINTKK